MGAVSICPVHFFLSFKNSNFKPEWNLRNFGHFIHVLTEITLQSPKGILYMYVDFRNASSLLCM